ncbi:MAG TPA: hypothetical protein VEL28_17250 [Candidatus Binatia bacterium]|nr:hypothetical protein [Candidatus Binatia bacterium]
MTIDGIEHEIRGDGLFATRRSAVVAVASEFIVVREMPIAVRFEVRPKSCTTRPSRPRARSLSHPSRSPSPGSRPGLGDAALRRPLRLQISAIFSLSATAFQQGGEEGKRDVQVKDWFEVYEREHLFDLFVTEEYLPIPSMETLVVLLTMDEGDLFAER